MPRRNEAKTATNVPERVGPYEVLLPIAAGGMATVYLAHARGTGDFMRQVAIKVTHAHLRTAENFAAEMIEEAKLAGRIRHPNVVGVNDAGDDPHGVYLAMEYIEGDTLSGLVRYAKRQQLLVPANVGLRILVDALMGLHAAHELKDDAGKLVGLVHRDFSPQNILVGRDGLSRLADFGVAKAAIRLGNTRTGLVKGKIRYMSPEQARSMDIDRRCDVWAAGIVAWELFTGKRLYEDMNDTGMLLQLVERPPPSVLTIKPKTPVAVADVITKALTMDPKGRYATAAEMANALRAAARESGGLAEPTEVGAYVEEAYGHVLEKRRERAQEILRLRAEMGRLAGSAPPSEQPSTSGSHAVPSSHKTSGIRPREELLGQEPVITPLPGSPPPIRPPMATTPMDEPSESTPEGPPPIRPPPKIADEESTANGPLLPGAAAPTFELTPAEPTPGVAAPPASPPPTKRSPLLMAAVAAMALGGVAAAGLHLTQDDPAPPATAPVDTGVDTGVAETPPPPETAAPPIETAAPTATAEVDEADASTPEELAAEARNISIESKIPFVQLQLDARTVRLDQPETSIDVLLTEEERARTVRVIATALDGRRTAFLLKPDANEVELKFPRGGGGAKPDKGGAAPLASSPYER